MCGVGIEVKNVSGLLHEQSAQPLAINAGNPYHVDAGSRYPTSMIALTRPARPGSS